MMQQITGVINLSMPVIVLYQLYSAFLHTYWGIFICALMIGIIVYLLNKRATDNMVQALTHRPSGEWEEQLEMMIIQCGMNPNDVSLVYAYTNEQIIMTAYNTIIIDPVLWSSIASDPAAVTVTIIFDQHTAPTLSELQKQRLEEIKKIFFSRCSSLLFQTTTGTYLPPLFNQEALCHWICWYACSIRKHNCSYECRSY